MLWLTWQMWILLLLAFAGGVIVGWIARGQSDVAERKQPAAPAAPSPERGARSEPPPSPQPTTRPEASPSPGPAPETGGARASAAVAETGGGASSGESEDLTRIKGLGPRAAAKLKAQGVRQIAQIAAWTESDIDHFDAAIEGRGRIRRDDWVGQARSMAEN